MTKSRMRRTGSGYQAVSAWVTRPGTGTPYSRPERWEVNPPGPREEGQSYLRRSRLWSAHTGLPLEQSCGTGVEKSAEAIVAEPGEGPNLRMQGADGRTRGTHSSRKALGTT